MRLACPWVPRSPPQRTLIFRKRSVIFRNGAENVILKTFFLDLLKIHDVTFGAFFANAGADAAADVQADCAGRGELLRPVQGRILSCVCVQNRQQPLFELFAKN